MKVIYFEEPILEIIHLDNIHGSATIHIDQYGVPFINGTSDLANYYALGFVQAKHRLWELHFKKMVTLGRLSEVIITFHFYYIFIISYLDIRD